jgi:signal transduction histidine kinase
MLHDFLIRNRAELIELCRAKVSRRRVRPNSGGAPAQLEHGIPLFLDQLALMLIAPAPGDAAGKATAAANIADGATRHGSELLGSELTIDQVVHAYGDLCQSITELAQDQGATITVEEFGKLNMRLDNAIAGAVTEFSRERDVRKVDEGELATNERLGVLAHEMRNLLNTAILAIGVMKAGGAGFGGATAAALDRSLIGMRVLIDRTLASVRLEGEAPQPAERIEIAQFVSEVQIAARLEAEQRGCELAVSQVAPGLYVEADRHILASAVSNLLQNAFKFTHPHSHVTLRAYASGDRVLIEVEDRCGGIAPEVLATLFRPFTQGSSDRSGVGLGLSLSRRGVEAGGGTLSVRDIPGRGCIFTIGLPRTN